MADNDQLSRLLNTAIIATKIPRQGNYSARFQELVQSEALGVILQAIKSYAQQKGITEDAAAQTIAQTFRDLDKLWDDYIFQEGLERLKSQISN